MHLVAHVQSTLKNPEVLVTGKKQQLCKEACTANDLTSDCIAPPENLSSISIADPDPPPSLSSIFHQSPKAKVAAGPLSGIHPKSAPAPDIQHCDDLHLDPFHSVRASDVQHFDELHRDPFQSLRASDIQQCDKLHRKLLQSANDNNPQLRPSGCYKSSPPEGFCSRPDVKDEQQEADKLATRKNYGGADCHAQETWTPAVDHTIYDRCSCCCGDLCVDTVKSGVSSPVALLPQRLQASGLHGRFLWGASYPIME